MLCSPLTVAEDKQQLQQTFDQGMAYAKERDYLAASAQFRKMLKDNPNLLRPRLELARVLYEDGEYRQAKYHFEQVLASALPPQVRKNVQAFLLKIRQQLPSFNLALNLFFNEQIPKREKTTYLFGLASTQPTQYENTGIRQHGYHFSAMAKVPLLAQHQVFTQLEFSNSNNTGNKKDTTYLKATLGKHFRLPNAASITPEIGFHHLIYDDRKLYNGVMTSLRYFQPISRADYLTLNLNYQHLHYASGYQRFHGNQKEISASYIKLPSASSRIDLRLAWLQSTAKDDSRALERPSMALSYSQDFASAWTVGINLRANRSYYQKADFFDNGKKKKDRQETVEITILNRLWHIYNISPKLSIGKTWHHSNIDTYGSSDPYIRLGFSQRF